MYCLVERSLKLTGCRVPSDYVIVMSAKMDSAMSLQTSTQVCARFAFDEFSTLIPVSTVFLDLPAPWEAIPHVTKTLRVSYSPATPM